MLDATMPDGSRIQMTLSNEVTTKGSTFTIRKFRADPFTPPDLIQLNTLSADMLAYFWLAVENRVNALIAGGTASGKTTILNALSLFIPREAKIVSIEETREINLPHPNWIPGVSRSGFGEIVANKMVGEIDMYDLMKAALRQRPEYILVGEIRGREAYVLFQAMATGHATYSTVHADSAKSLIHRLEGKPIDIPRIMLNSLDIVSIHITTRVKGKRVRRCKQIIEIIDIDPTTKEILTNEVFRWDPIEDKFIYTGKSYVLEGIRARWDMSKEEITREIRQRAEVLDWMRNSDVRTFKEVAKAISRYTENSTDFLKKMKTAKKPENVKKVLLEDIEAEEEEKKAKKKASEKKKTKQKPKNEEDKEEKEEIVEAKETNLAFKEIQSIDDETAELLFNNGLMSVDDLVNSTIKDISKIKGIKKKKAKQIYDEIQEKYSIEDSEEQIQEVEPVKEDNNSNKIDTFKDLESIDDNTAVLLYEAGYTSIDELKDTSIKDLTKVEGIKKKTAKKIIKDLETLENSSVSSEDGEENATK
jgi:type IV secretory pathway ATPase VirB11/archaellum biosynthesis ATPase/ERCC4-type nuclease